MRSLSFTRLLPALLTLVLLPGAGIPLEELRLYGEAFQQTRAAGQILLDRLEPIIAAVPPAGSGEGESPAPPPSGCGIDRHGAPSCFDPRLIVAGGRAAEVPSIAARRAALDLIAAYNGILIDLSSGREPREMQTRLGEVVQFASTILTLSGVGSGLPALIPPVTASLQKFTDGIRTSRAGSLTRQEILANRDTVKGLLRQLRDDAPKLYEIYRLKRLDDRREALAAKNEALAGGVSRDLRQFHASLALYVALIDKTVDAVDALAAAAEAPTSGKPPGITSLFREAMELRRDANTLWDSVRKVGR